MKRILALLFFGLIGTAPLLAQQVLTNSNVYGYWEDVIQFSDLYGGGSARMSAIQNAQAGLGGDISNAATNPAGLGLMRRSEFSVSPGLLATNTLNTQLGNQTTGRGSNFSIGQLGLAFASQPSAAIPSAFKGGTFAITLTRLNNFNNYRTYNTNIAYDGKTPNSYIDQFLDNAARHQIESVAETRDPNAFTRFILSTPIDQNGQLFEHEYETRYAYSRYLIDTVNVDGVVKYYSRIPTGDVNQQGRIFERGYQNQVDFAYGASLNDKIYLGGGIGVPYLNASRQTLYTETLLNTASTNPQALQYTGFSFDRREELAWSGIGFNAKVGALVQVNKHVRAGLSIQSPTWYSIRNDYTFSLDARFVNQNGQPINYDTTFDSQGAAFYTNPEFSINEQQTVYRIVRTQYAIRTPGQASAGVSFLDSKLGFVSVQLTAQPYSMARLGGNSYAGDNAYLKTNTVLASQLRVGAEYILSPLLRIRGGFGWLQNPVKNQADTYAYSVGAGMRLRDWYLDAAVNVHQRAMGYTVYAYAPRISSIANHVQTQITFGAYF